MPMNKIPAEGLADSGVIAGQYGLSNAIPVITVNKQGQVTQVGSATPVDATKVAKTGDTMTGTLVIQGGRLQVKENAAGAFAFIEMFDDESPNGKKYIHANSNAIGFLGGSGNWISYTNETGNFWTAAYGWLQDYFFWNIGNCAGHGTGSPAINCYGSGDSVTGYRHELMDNGGNLAIRTVNYLTNCNCNCNCNCACA